MSKEISISYIVIDLKHIQPRLLEDKNILYNFASKILISRLITEKDTGTTINILFDNKTTKTASKNSLREYIIAYIVYEEGLDAKTMDGAVRAIGSADTLIIGGTSLVVYPAAGFIDYFRGKHLVVINKSSTEKAVRAELNIAAPIGEILGSIQVR